MSKFPPLDPLHTGYDAQPAESEAQTRLSRSFDYEAFMAQEQEATDHDELSSEQIHSVAENMITLIDTVYDSNLEDPMRYIEASIRRKVMASSLRPDLKPSVNAQTLINVTYYERRFIPTLDPIRPPVHSRQFPLSDIVTDSYRRELKGFVHQVHWPVPYPKDLTAALESANLQVSYQNDVKRQLSSPQAKAFIKKRTAIQVAKRLADYASNEANHPVFRTLADAYASHGATLRLVDFSTRFKRSNLPQALYLNYPGQQYGGLLIFIDAKPEDAVVPLPTKHTRLYIESSLQLRRLVLTRLPLYLQLKDGYQTLKYHRSYTGPLVTAWPPLDFRHANDVFDELHTLKIKRMLSDIDTMVSTDDERLTDRLLEVGGALLQGLAIVVTLPAGGTASVAARLLASFLLGQGAAVMEAVRGELADTPQEAEEHYNNALFAAVLEIVGPIGFELLGHVLPKLAKSRVARKVFNHIRKTRSLKGKPSLATTIKISSVELNRIKTEVIESFQRGPELAQARFPSEGHFIKRTLEGHDVVVYRGKTFRGDMRPPEEIFENGFKLRTSAAELQQDIHQATGVRGGFGGGHDALDIDGRGISTSVFYKKDGAGSFFYGGHKGGHTYVIDGSKLDGYHLYQNHHNALTPNVAQRLRQQAWEINYAQDIPSNAILGAYDAQGVFIPNPAAIKKYARTLCYIRTRDRLAVAAAAAAAHAAGKKPS